jgi:hypothetical protein
MNRALRLSRARKDIQTTVAFLTTHMRNPDEDDWAKLKMLLMYVKSTINMPLILIVENLNIIKWWVDASFAIQNDRRGHTGATMSLGKGSIIGMLKKQKINTMSLMESELIRADDASPSMMRTIYFVEAQCFTVEESVLYQDNLNAMLLERNGKKSSSKRTHHISICYFFIKDRIASNEMTVKHCPTAEMLADHFTKPLQGAPFRKFRAEIQGIPADTSDANLDWKTIKETEAGQVKKPGKILPSPQECVGRPAKGPSADYSESVSCKRYIVTARRGTAHANPSALKLHSLRGASSAISPQRGRSYILTRVCYHGTLKQ